MFDSFHQAESSTTRNFGGTGLGLPISKSIIEMMGGKIWIESEIGKGAVFTFTVCLAPAEDRKENAFLQDALQQESNCGQIAASTFKGRRLLLVEDVEINREIFLSVLEPTLLEIECAENGAEAVRMFENSPGKYDIIFMDVQMPVMDGYEATKAIRNLNTIQAKGIPIIAITANVFREDVEKCIKSGMNDHIGKPIDFNEVIMRLGQYLS